MIEKLPVPPRFASWIADQNPRPQDSQSPEALGIRRFVARHLMLWGRDVESWRGWFGEVPHLLDLRIQGSATTSLPEDVGQLQCLQTLVILNVNLSEFPMWICQMMRLRELSVRGTNISNVPDELAKLVHLRKLELGNNLLRRLDVDLRGCRKLGCLLIPDNDLEELPSKLPAETVLGLAGTPFRKYTGHLFKELPSE